MYFLHLSPTGNADLLSSGQNVFPLSPKWCTGRFFLRGFVSASEPQAWASEGVWSSRPSCRQLWAEWMGCESSSEPLLCPGEDFFGGREAHDIFPHDREGSDILGGRKLTRVRVYVKKRLITNREELWFRLKPQRK